jgi:hypothetical protein
VDKEEKKFNMNTQQSIGGGGNHATTFFSGFENIVKKCGSNCSSATINNWRRLFFAVVDR